MKDKNSRQITKYIVIAIITLIALCALAVTASAQRPFAGKTKHKTVKKMTKIQVRKAQKGKTFYYRKHRRIVKRKLHNYGKK